MSVEIARDGEISTVQQKKIEMDKKELEEKKGLFEAFLFMANEPLSLKFFSKYAAVDKKVARQILKEIMAESRQGKRGMLVLEIAGGYQLVTNPIYSENLRGFFANRKKERIRKSTLEVLAIIAYKQPIHVAAMDELRGASSRQHIGLLTQKKLVKPVKRLELPGRPMAYGTTQEFLKYFGLNSLKDMPSLEEIKELNLESL